MKVYLAGEAGSANGPHRGKLAPSCRVGRERICRKTQLESIYAVHPASGHRPVLWCICRSGREPRTEATRPKAGAGQAVIVRAQAAIPRKPCPPVEERSTGREGRGCDGAKLFASIHAWKQPTEKYLRSVRRTGVCPTYPVVPVSGAKEEGRQGADKARDKRQAGRQAVG